MKTFKAYKSDRWRLGIRASILAFVLFCLLSSSPLASQELPADVFNQVWQTVEANFYDPKLNGVDWKAIRQKYEQQAMKAPSVEAAAGIINQMLSELKTSHTYFYTRLEPAYYQLLGIFKDYIAPAVKNFLPNGSLKYPGIGIFTKTIQDKTFISGILEGSPAAQAGLKVGDRILSADGRPFQAIASFANKPGKEVQLLVQRQPSTAMPQAIAVIPKLLDPAEMFLDAMRASIEIIERDGRKIGYVHIWSYAGDRYQELLEQELTFGRLKEADGLVLDIRDGWGGASPTYLNIFTGRVPTLAQIGRDGKRNVVEYQWQKPTVMLVNQGSRSGKEILAYGFKKYGLGTLVGTRTAGAVVAGRPYIMKDGSLLYLAVLDVFVDGDRLEGNGVIPDIEVPFPIEYAQGIDPQKEKAVAVALEAVKRRAQKAPQL